MKLKHSVFYILRPHGGRLVLPGGGESFLPQASDRMSLLDAVNTEGRGTKNRFFSRCLMRQMCDDPLPSIDVFYCISE